MFHWMETTVLSHVWKLRDRKEVRPWIKDSHWGLLSTPASSAESTWLCPVQRRKHSEARRKWEKGSSQRKRGSSQYHNFLFFFQTLSNISKAHCHWAWVGNECHTLQNSEWVYQCCTVGLMKRLNRMLGCQELPTLLSGVFLRQPELGSSWMDEDHKLS